MPSDGVTDMRALSGSPAKRNSRQRPNLVDNRHHGTGAFQMLPSASTVILCFALSRATQV